MAHDHEALPDAVGELSAEVRVLRDAIDELREVLQWQSQNPHPPARSASVLKSMATSPTAADWSENLKLSSGIPAIVEQRIAARYADEITKLLGLLDELSDCPELDPANDIAPITRQVLSRVNGALNEPIELPEQISESTHAEPPTRSPGKLF